MALKNEAFSKAEGGQLAKTLHKLVEGKGYNQVIGPTSAFGKDLLPRLGGLLDSQPISDVVDITDGKF